VAPPNKPRNVDVGPAGILTPVDRAIYDRRAAAQAPAATGGRPAVSPAPEAGLTLVKPDSVLFKGGSDIYRQPPNPMADPSDDGSYTPPPVKPIINDIAPGAHTIEQYTLGNQPLIQHVATNVDSLFTMLEERGDGHLVAQAKEQFGSGAEFAQRLVAAMQRSFEPGTRAPSLPDFIRQSRLGREVYSELQAWQQNRAFYQAAPIEKPKG
jgi:hypothetical protein